MKKEYKNYLKILMLGVFLTSCVSSKEMVYFQPNENIKLNETILNFEPTIQIGDLLFVNISSDNATASLPFNLYETPISVGYTTNAKPLHYLVNSDGVINMPTLGNIKVKELTTKQFTEKLEIKLDEYLKEPVVNVRITNFKVTVLGEVKMPGTYSVPNERITILEALGLAGDLTIQGKRANIQLIREQQGKRMIIPIDLTNKKLFNSPYYYLAQNDVIYVSPNKTKMNSSAVGANAGIIISSISTLISLIAILTR